MESMKLDTRVTRVTGDRKAILTLIRKLEVGDKFTHDGKLYLLTTKKVRFGDRDSGDRVRYGRSWYVVCRHGFENVLFLCVPSDDPFSTELESNSSVFPWPGEMMELLTFEEIVKEPVSARTRSLIDLISPIERRPK